MIVRPTYLGSQTPKMVAENGRTIPTYRDELVPLIQGQKKPIIVEYGGTKEVVYNLSAFCRREGISYTSVLNAFRRDGIYRPHRSNVVYTLVGFETEETGTTIFQEPVNLETVDRGFILNSGANTTANNDKVIPLKGRKSRTGRKKSNKLSS